VLGLLSHELFVEIKKRSEDELKATFGAEAGKYLFEEAQCEDRFASVNMIDGSKMTDLKSEEFRLDQRRAAIQNAKDVERQILNLISIFSRKEMRDKLQKEFAFLYKTPNEVDVFNEQFARLKRLWMAKLSTPLEEFLSVQESLIKLRMSTKQLQEAKHVKEEAYKKDVD